MTKVFKLEIECENDAFQHGECPMEVARILKDLANYILRCNTEVTGINLRDLNGNTVGQASFTHKK